MLNVCNVKPINLLRSQVLKISNCQPVFKFNNCAEAKHSLYSEVSFLGATTGLVKGGG